jgi:hypothetical protein
LLDRPTIFSQATARRRLAHSHRAFARCFGVRILLGDVELLLVSEMDLSYSGVRFFSGFRDAATRIWRLRSVRAGVVCVEEFPLAKRATAGTLVIKLRARGRANQHATRLRARINYPMPCGTTSFRCRTFSAPVSWWTTAAPSRGIVLANGRPLNTPSKISFTRKVRPSVLVTLSIFGSQ